MADTRPVLLFLQGDPDFPALLEEQLGATYELLFAESLDGALEHLATGDVALLVMDHEVDDGVGAIEARGRLLAAGHDVPMSMLTAQGDEDQAVEALRHGFVDYMANRGRSMRADLLRKRIDNCLELARLKRENEDLQRRIEESQQRLFNIYDSLDDVIMQVDKDCRVVSLNRSAAAQADCEPKDAVGHVCHELFDFFPCDARRRKEQCHIYRTFLEDETIRGQREEPKTGSVYQYMTFITTLADADYTVYRETDVTEKRRLEERISNALESLGVNPPVRSDDDGSES